SSVCSSDLLGGFTEADRQHAGGERVEAAGMPGLGGTKQALGHLQGTVAAHTGGFVEQQNAVHRTAAMTLSGHLVLLERSVFGIGFGRLAMIRIGGARLVDQHRQLARLLGDFVVMEAQLRRGAGIQGLRQFATEETGRVLQHFFRHQAFFLALAKQREIDVGKTEIARHAHILHRGKMYAWVLHLELQQARQLPLHLVCDAIGSLESLWPTVSAHLRFSAYSERAISFTSKTSILSPTLTSL